MKLLTISDTHGRYGNSQNAIEKLYESIFAVLHLGDMVADAKFLEAQYKKLTFHYVAGNCDYYISAESNLPVGRVVEYNGVRIFMAHGHSHSVNRNYKRLAEAALAEKAKVAVCGHTHIPFCQKVGETLVVNPGSIEFPRGGEKRPSYAVLDVSNCEKPEAGIVFAKG